MKDIKLQFKNYKIFKDKLLEFKGGYLYFVKGANKQGKTSTKNSMLFALTAKELTPDPITTGEQEGHRVFTVPHRNGNTYDIHTDFSGDKTKWYVIDQDGNKIDKVTEIRNLFNYVGFTAEEFIKKSTTAKGRREQLETLLKLLPQQKQDNYKYHEAKENELYPKRTEIGKSLEDARAVLNSIHITDEERGECNKKEKYVSALSQLKKKKDELLVSDKRKEIQDELNQEERDYKVCEEAYNKDKSNKLKNINDIEGEIARLQAKLETEKEELNIIEADYHKRTENAEKRMYELNKKIKNTPDNSIEIEKLTERIDNGEDLLRKVNDIESKINSKEIINKKFIKISKEYSKIDTEIENHRKAKKELFKDGNLDKFNIEFKDDYLYIDGFKFDENQVCTSDVYKLVARILIELNKDVPVIIMGNSSELDNNSLKEMYQLAKKHNYAMVFDEVDRDNSELKVVCYENLL